MSFSYDLVAYPGHPFVQTHPDRLSTIGRLLGLDPPPIGNCRVLELACGDGGNLIPMALTLPGARFVGIDLAGQAISQGNRTIEALGLTNIKLLKGDLLELDPANVDGSGARFDYIVTHGLYSWCPPVVRDAILRIARESLSPRGIAYVSYNALPGGRIRQMLREMMLFHAADFDDPMQRASEARALLQLVANGRVRQDGFNALVKEEVARMTDEDLWFLFHDELGEIYEPVYLHDFVAHAEKFGFQYLADANFYNLQPARLTAEAQETLSQLAPDDRVLREQYVDFIQCCRFHHTLLCRQDQVVDYPPIPARLENLFVSSTATTVSGQTDLREGVEEQFLGPLDSSMKTAHPIAKALLGALIRQSPQALSFDALLAQLDAARDDVREQASQILLATSLAGLTDLHSSPRPLVSDVSARPVASPLARYQATRKLPLTTLTHATVEHHEAFELKLLPLLDGTRDHAALLRKLRVKKDVLEFSLVRLAKLGFLQA